MNILDKLKAVDQSKIKNEKLKANIQKALTNYENKDDLLEIEESNYEKIYELTKKAYPEAIKEPQKPEPKRETEKKEYVFVVYDSEGKPDSMQISVEKAKAYISRRPAAFRNKWKYEKMELEKAEKLFEKPSRKKRSAKKKTPSKQPSKKSTPLKKGDNVEITGGKEEGIGKVVRVWDIEGTSVGVIMPNGKPAVYDKDQLKKTTKKVTTAKKEMTEEECRKRIQELLEQRTERSAKQKKRVASGKPPTKTPAETIKTATQSAEKKIKKIQKEGRQLSATELKSIQTSIDSLVDSIKNNKRLIRELIKRLEKLL